MKTNPEQMHYAKQKLALAARAWFAESGRGVVVVRADAPAEQRVGYYGDDALDHSLPDAALVRDMLRWYVPDHQAVLAFINAHGQAVAEVVTIEEVQ